MSLILLLLVLRPLGANVEDLNPILTLAPDRVGSQILIDGVLESTWEDGLRFDNFAEFMPGHQLSARVPTEGYITYDDDHLYLAFVCYDPDISDLRASMTDRDKIYQDDFVGIIIDTYQDQQRAYEFFSNPLGIQGDMLWQANRTHENGFNGGGAIWQANGGEDESYDAVWESEGRIFDDKWVVEMKIPFSSMRYPNKEEQNWSVHMVRTYPRNNRYQFSWMPISQNNNSFMGQAGNLNLAFALGALGTKSLEVLPYVVSTRTSSLVDDGTGNGQWSNEGNGTRAGFSARYTLTSNNVLDATYRPDFSQIESDAGRINTNNPFAFFYQERRPFFVEGNDIFQVDRGARGLALDTPADLIYTRSIEDPIVAGKITGKSGRFTYGMISALDDNAPFILPFADATAVLNTEERAWSNILRTKFDLGEETYIGTSFTNRQLEMGGSNLVTSVDASIRLSDNYTFTALSAMTRTDEPTDSLLSQQIASQVGDYTFRSGNRTISAALDGEEFYGHIFKTRFLRQARHWDFSLGYQDYSPGVRADNSSIFSNDGKIVDGWTGYSFQFENHSLLSVIQPHVAIWRKFDYSGEVKDTGIKPALFVQLQRQTSVSLGGFLFNREKFRGVRFDDQRQAWMYIATNIIEKVSGDMFLQYGKTINRLGVEGDPQNPFELVPNMWFNTSVTLRPSSQLTDQFQYVSNSLWTNSNERIVRQQIFRNTLSYQFSKQLFFRLISEMNLTDRADSHTRAFSIEPLFSYKLNPFTVFYAGANIGGRVDPFLNHRGMSRTDQALFIKFQYLWQAI